MFWIWAEDQVGKGTIKEVSSLQDHFHSHYLQGNKFIRSFCDSCTSQKKNRHVIHTFVQWLKTESPENVSVILMVFPLTNIIAIFQLIGYLRELTRYYATNVSSFLRAVLGGLVHNLVQLNPWVMSGIFLIWKISLQNTQNSVWSVIASELSQRNILVRRR